MTVGAKRGQSLNEILAESLGIFIETALNVELIEMKVYEKSEPT